MYPPYQHVRGPLPQVQMALLLISSIAVTVMLVLVRRLNSELVSPPVAAFGMIKRGMPPAGAPRDIANTTGSRI